MSVRERWRKIKLHKGTENNGGEGSARVGGKWLGWTLGVAWGRRATEELGEERPEGGGPGRDIRWDGAPGCRTSQWGCLRQKAASTNGRTGEGWELHAGCTGEMGTGEVLLFYFHAGITTEMCMVPDTIHQQGRNCGSRRERWFAPREGLVRGRHPPPAPSRRPERGWPVFRRLQLGGRHTVLEAKASLDQCLWVCTGSAQGGHSEVWGKRRRIGESEHFQKL